MKYLLSLLIVIATATPSWLGAFGNEIPIGGILHNLPMQGLTASSKFISEYRGKPLIINVWASYCGPCLAEMDSLERLWQRYGDQFNVIGISIDDYRDRADDFLAKTDTTFPNFIDRQLALESMLGAKTIPLTLLIDDQNRVLHKVRGAQEWDSPEMVEFIGQTFAVEL